MNTIDPIRIYQVNGEVCPLKSAFAVVGVSTNTSLIAALTGRRIRVMGAFISSQGAAVSTFSFKNGSGGTVLFGATAPSNAVATPNIFLPVNESGYVETDTGVGLFCDVATTAAAITVFYIDYIPV